MIPHEFQKRGGPQAGKRKPSQASESITKRSCIIIRYKKVILHTKQIGNNRALTVFDCQKLERLKERADLSIRIVKNIEG